MDRSFVAVGLAFIQGLSHDRLSTALSRAAAYVEKGELVVSGGSLREVPQEASLGVRILPAGVGYLPFLIIAVIS